MEQTIQKLTDLIGIIIERFPDENDLKGFPGISRALILESLYECNSILTTLKGHDNHFEVILLKREAAEFFEKLFRELEEKFDKIKGDKFNTILKLIFKLRSLIRETYAAVINTAPIRTETDIAKAKAELDLLTANNEELKRINQELVTLKDTTIQNSNAIIAEVTTLRDGISGIKTEVEGMKTTSATIVADFQDKQRVATENEKAITEFVGTIETKKVAVELIQQNTTTWELDIKGAKESLTAKVSEYDALNERSKTIQAEIEATHEKIFGKKDADGKPVGGYLQDTEELKNKFATFLTEQQTKFSTQFKEIESLLPGATSTGLAEAYQKQKNSYTKPIQLWSVIFILSIALMTGLGAYLIYKQLQVTTESTLNSAFISLLKDLPFFIPTLWMAAYASKQQSQYKRLQQEYAFKETNAKSFHGHKMQIEELMKEGGTDTDLLSQLVAQLVIITAYNPSETLDNKTHEDSPPIFKLVEKYFPSLSKAKGKE
jgi:hypothetical protein